MREFCIITVYNSMNLGSYLQAMSLAKYLSFYGKVYFLNTHSRNPNKTFLKNICRSILKHDFKLFCFECKKYKFFLKNQKGFDIIDLNKCNSNMTFIFGSDEIWNIKRKEMNQYPIFWGEGIDCKKISYGISINQTTENDLEKWIYKNNLNNFYAISVRDEWTKNIINKYTNKEIKQVVDPTMLFDYNHYIGLANKMKIKNYIAVYTFGHRMDSDRINMVKKLGKYLKKRL